MTSGRISRVLAPAADLAASVKFYERAFGLHLKFRDGERYAEFHRTEVALALVSQGESITDRAAAISIAVPDVDAALAAVRDAGGTVFAGATHGPHEVRAVVQDPDGNMVVVYSSLPPASAGAGD